jgi:hypothetical protein
MSQRVPADVLALVYCQFELIDLLAAASTCRTWHAAARKKTAWPKTVRITFDVRRMLAPSTRSLSQTVWASCTNIVVSTRNACKEDVRVWFNRRQEELPCVSALSIICEAADESVIRESCHLLLARITSLRTNRVAVLQSTQYKRLTRLTITDPCQHNDADEWIRTLSMLSALTHIRVDTCLQSRMFGQALAQLSHVHHTLRTIYLPCESFNSCQMLAELISNPALDLSSICVLRGAPLGIMCESLRRLPRLSTYDEWMSEPYWTVLMHKEKKEAEEEARCNDGPISLVVDTNAPQIDPCIAACLPNLTDLTICRAHPELLGPYINLRRLCLQKDCAPIIDVNLDSIAPNVEHLLICEPMEWVVSSGCLTHVLMLPRLQHLEIRSSDIATEKTMRILFHSMVQSFRWRQVTCAHMPTPFFLKRGHNPLVSLIRWNVVCTDARVTRTFRPRIQLSHWRAGLPTHQVIWERV